jgi:hypothetical protein
LDRRDRRKTDHCHHLMARACYRVIFVYHRSPKFVPLYFVSLSLAPKKIQNVRNFFVWCGFTCIRIIRIIIRIYFSLRAHCAIFECLGRLIFALSPVKRSQVLQRCRHRWRVHFRRLVPSTVFRIGCRLAIAMLILFTLFRNLFKN